MMPGRKTKRPAVAKLLNALGKKMRSDLLVCCYTTPRYDPETEEEVGFGFEAGVGHSGFLSDGEKDRLADHMVRALWDWLEDNGLVENMR